MKVSSSKKVKELEQKVKELEQAVGQKQIMIDYLEKMMEIAKQEFKIDIQKKTTPHNLPVQEKQAKNRLFHEQAI